MNLTEQDPQPLPSLYREHEIKKCFSHPKTRPEITQPSDEPYRYIALTKNQVAIVDIEDYERLARYSWQAHWSKDTQTYYAQRGAPRLDGKHGQMYVSMHRQIMAVEDRHILVDHRNRSETLDNRKENLRIADRSQNGANSKISKNNKSGFKGVYYHKANNKWAAHIRSVNGRKFLGLFATPEDAHAAYCKAAAELFGEFAHF